MLFGRDGSSMFSGQRRAGVAIGVWCGGKRKEEGGGGRRKKGAAEDERAFGSRRATAGELEEKCALPRVSCVATLSLKAPLRWPTVLPRS